MIFSMTGFGRGTAAKGDRELQVELKSVNHRYLDIAVRMPKTLNVFEERIRKTVAAKLSRGHIDVFVTYRNTGAASRTVNADLHLVGAYMEALGHIRQNYPGLQDDVTLLGVSRLPDVFTVLDGPEDEAAIGALLDEAMEQALSGLLTMREMEGKNLIADIEARLNTITGTVSEIEKLAPKVVFEYRDRLTERIAVLARGIQLDEARLQTEVALFADRCSIVEETVRLQSHLTQFMNIAKAGGPVGRKLDFIVQEINREANTIGSKANDLQITNGVLEIKGEVEKIREQVQNIE